MSGKPIHLGSKVPELSKLFTNETQFDTRQPIFDTKLEGNLQLHYMCSDFFVWSIKANDLLKFSIKLQEEENLFDFIGIAKDQPLFCNKNINVIGKF